MILLKSVTNIFVYNICHQTLVTFSLTYVSDTMNLPFEDIIQIMF